MNRLTGTLLGLFGLEQKALPPLRPLSGSATWWPVIRESYTGAWQSNVEVPASTALAYFAVYACVTLIAGDIAKLCLRLVKKDANGIWTEEDNPAYSPVLRKPNRYQTIQKFVEQWMVSKLTTGNTYVLKQRDQRGVVKALYVLSPSRVTPLVTPDGAVYYQIRRDDLSQQAEDSITVPASEIIHDIMCALYHPLVGVSPIYAAGMAATQGLSIQNNSTTFFGNGANPSGMLTAPGTITDATAARLLTTIANKKIGETLVGGDGLKYEKFSMSAVDAQLIEQLKWTADTVCSCYHVPPYMIGVGPPPPYANVEPLVQQYYGQCLQTNITGFETCLDEGLGIGPANGSDFGTEFDINDLIWMDAATKIAAAGDAVGKSVLTIDESRKTYLGKGPVKGGDTIWMQQQNYSLAALDKRDRNDPFAKPAPQPQPPQLTSDAPPADDMTASFSAALYRKASEELHAA